MDDAANVKVREDARLLTGDLRWQTVLSRNYNLYCTAVSSGGVNYLYRYEPFFVTDSSMAQITLEHCQKRSL